MTVKISASMLKAFNVCPMMVYHRRHKTPTTKSASMIVGSLIHDMIDNFESEGGIDVKDYIAAMVRELSGGEPIKFTRWQTIPALTKLIHACYENYLSIKDSFPLFMSAEVEFKFEYRPDVLVVGKWDQLRDNNTIVEFKSSHREPSDEFLAADIQATFYIWAYKEIFHVTPTYYYVHLPTGNIYEVYRNNFDDLYTNIDDYILACEKEHYPKYKDGYKCNNCFYKSACLTENEGCKLINQMPKRKKEKKPKGNFFLP